MADGVEKLTAYLIQTRRQAEQSIDCLNKKIIELEKLCEEHKEKITQLEEEVLAFNRHYSTDIIFRSSALTTRGTPSN